MAALYRRLSGAWGPQNWWPADTPFEVVVGAILTQNTSWNNVERALANLRASGALSLAAIQAMDLHRLKEHLRPAGYFRQKSLHLKELTAYIVANYAAGGDAESPVAGQLKTGGPFKPAVGLSGAVSPESAANDLASAGVEAPLGRFLAQPTEKLRAELLARRGVGPETADSILLYAGNHPVFVVDAYTRRIFERHGLCRPETTYDEIRLLVEQGLRNLEERVAHSSPAVGLEWGSCSNQAKRPTQATEACMGHPKLLPKNCSAPPPTHAPSPVSSCKRSELVQRYNEFHALLVQVGKHHCLKSKPRCEGCPLARLAVISGGKAIYE